MFGSICLGNLCEVNSFVNVLLNAMVRKVKTAASSKASLEGQAVSVEEQEDEQRPFGKRPREERLATLLGKGFQPVNVVRVTAVQGGFLKHPEIVPAMTVERGGATDCFIQLIRDADWLCRAVSGEGRGLHPLKRVELLETLRAGIAKATGRHEIEAEVAEEVVNPDEQLEFSEEEEDPSKLDRVPVEKRRRAKREFRMASVVALSMPARCAEAYPEEAERQLRDVRLYVLPGHKWKAIWIHSDDLPWALEYMHTQRALQGVPMVKKAKVAALVGNAAGAASVEAGAVEPSSVEAGAAGSSSVEAGFGSPPKISWTFKESAWEATAFSPVGPKKRVLKLDSLQLWEAQLVDEQVQQLADLERPRLKTLAYGVMAKWAAAMAQGHAWTAEAARNVAVAA